MSRTKDFELLEDLKERGVLANCANPENFTTLDDQQKVLYLGIDCTSDSLHIGHLLPFMQTVRLAKNGFAIKILLGGATSKIGDPSDKLKERPFIEHQVLLANQKSIEKQLLNIFKRGEENLEILTSLPLHLFFSSDKELLHSIYQIIGLDLTEKNKRVTGQHYLTIIWPLEIERKSFAIIDNRKGLNKLTFVDFINEYGRNISINYLLAKETIKQRVSSKNGLSFSAFTYSLLQAYDFLHLYREYKCHGQVGSNDQGGNLTTGLKMISSFDQQNKCFALAFNLILNDNGKKISKSDTSTNIVGLTNKKTSPKQLFDYFSNMSDEKAIDFSKKFTFLSIEQINSLLIINKPGSLRIIQRILVELFFFLIYGKDGLIGLAKNSTVNQKKNKLGKVIY